MATVGETVVELAIAGLEVVGELVVGDRVGALDG